MSILPSPSQQQRPRRSFGAIVAAETVADASLWISQVSGTERTRRLGLLADMLLAANPETGETDELVLVAELIDEPTQPEGLVIDQDVAADLAVETLVAELVDPRRQRDSDREVRVYPEAWYTKTAEGRAVTAASPFRNGPRYVTRSARTTELAAAGTAVRP
ncbi:hypothetical protein ABT095_33600 [Kitasatospora sp. NPDC002227]|uniref:hypothetical protein n=1 Tax=Kitasatospora sp. NPDC002227 TaxID=3154773 RepID=UPI00332EBE1C